MGLIVPADYEFQIPAVILQLFKSLSATLLASVDAEGLHICLQ